VGSANSSNTVRLRGCRPRERRAKAAYRIDYASEIQQDWLDGIGTVGVTSGASVPEVLVQEVLDDLADAGYADVSQVVTSAEEDLMFSCRRMQQGRERPGRSGPGGRIRQLDWQEVTDQPERPKSG
jgi:4-hydroxy-3-methylbut-2-enyl diphosphate reductase